MASVAVLGFAVLGARADTVPDPVVAAVNANDATMLEALSRSVLEAQERALSAGALLALRREDAEAIATLLPVIRSSASPLVRATAYLVLSDVYSREQRYRACSSAIRAALQLSPEAVNVGYRQAMVFAQTLEGVKPMQLLRETPGSLPITGEKEGVIRVPSEINGHLAGAMLDTGASFSTVSASVAKRFGIQMLSHAVSVGSSTESTVAVRLGIARRLQIGNAVLENVVFIVIPDSEWGPPRQYRISFIIGMPVLIALGRLEFVNSGAPRLFYDAPRGKSDSRPEAHSNMLLASFESLVLVRLPGADKPLQMYLDTGANHTHFTRNAIVDAPGLAAHAEPYVRHVAGMGGTLTEQRALRLPEATLTIGGQSVTVKNVIVSSKTSATSDGAVGEDAFCQGARWTMDFKTMTLAVSN